MDDNCVCLDCGQPCDVIHISGTIYDPPETFSACCLDAVTEGAKCECCGQLKAPRDMSVDVDGLCEDCVKTSIKNISRFIEAHGDSSDLKVWNFLKEI